MSHPARLSLRAPPHLPFIQGWPGIPPSPNRKQPAIHGTVELRIGPQPIKARWVRIEIRKHEAPPPGFPSSSSSSESRTWEHVGEIGTLWSAPEGKEWGNLEQADFKFYLPLPVNIPPTVEMGKNGGVRYELVAALCYRQKGGIFKKESAPIMKISEPLRITKHELHSAWPLYNTPDARTVSSQDRQINLTVQRPSSAFGPGDRILLTATIKSARPQSFKLKGFDCQLLEIITAIPTANPAASTKSRKSKPTAQPTSRSRIITSVRNAVDESVIIGGEKSARMELVMPPEKVIMTIESARSMEMRYELEVKAVFDGMLELRELKMGGIKYVVGPFARSHAQQAVRDIGYFDVLCPGQPEPSDSISPAKSSTSGPPQIRLTPSPNMNGNPPNNLVNQSTCYPSFPVPQPQVQGFALDGMRRRSSGTSATTMTTTGDYDPQPNGRPYSTVPASRQNLAFPNPHPAPHLSRSGTGRSIDISGYSTSMTSPSESAQEHERYTQSDAGHGEGNKRNSTGTTATFGRWDQGLKLAMGQDDGLDAVTERSPVTPVNATSGAPAAEAEAPLTPETSQQASTVTAGPSTGSIPHKMTNNWPSSEQEKLRLYNQARSRTVAAQSATGVRLDTLGLDDSAPPEYAPPLPAQPAEAYKAPSRPVSMYTAASPDKSTPESPQSGPPASPPTKSVLILSADEKDQLRRRFENRISASPRGQSAMPSSPVAGPSEPPTAEAPVETAGYLSGAEEKEQQRRRFEDAQKCVVSAGRGTAPSSPEAGSSSLPNGNAVPSENAVPYDVIFPAASSSTADPSSDAGPSSSAGPSSDSGPSTSSGPSKEMQGKPANGGLSEKEQMKRYYEARAKVTQAKTRPASAAIEASPPAPITSPAPTNRPVSAAPINEKEQMRRYYEAMERVQRASGGGSASGSIPVAPASAIDSPPKAGASTCTPAPVNGYMSASDEKAMMQKRFEDAQAAVKRNVTPSSQPTTASSVGHQRTASLMSTAPSSPPDSPLIRDSTVRAGKAKATGPMSPTLSFGEGFSYGPPLPLPARPPMEYINLLSPVEESSNRWASILSTNGDAGGSRAK